MDSVQQKWKKLKLGSILEKITCEGWYTEKVGDQFEVIDIDKCTNTYHVRRVGGDKRLLLKRKADLVSFKIINEEKFNWKFNLENLTPIEKFYIYSLVFILGFLLGVIINSIKF